VRVEVGNLDDLFGGGLGEFLRVLPQHFRGHAAARVEPSPARRVRAGGCQLNPINLKSLSL